MRCMRPASLRALALATITVFGSVFRAGAAHAQRDEVTASAQFEKGLADMEAGRYASGCPALSESYRLDPRPGVVFTLAECEVKWGKIASALAHYDDFAQLFSRLPADQQARQRERLKIAMAQTKALAAVVPQLTIVLPDQASSSAVVRRDGVALGRPSLGVALPVDPGEHVLLVEAADGGSREERIVISKGEKLRVELRLPAPLPKAVGTTTTPPPPGDKNVTPPPREEPRSGGHTLAFVAFGVGAAGLVTGGVAGTIVLGKKSTIDQHCVDTACDAAGLEAAHSAKTIGLVSTIGVGVGVLGVAVGFVLLATDKGPPPRAAIRPVLAPIDHGGAVGAVGVF